MARRGQRAPGPEKAFQAKLVQLLHLHGYVVEHTYRLRCDDGSWRTGNTLNGKPDLIAWRPPRVLAIEVKAEGGRLRPEQQACLSWFAGIPNARAWVLSPAGPTWDAIVEWVADPKLAPRTFGFDQLTLLDAFRVLATADQRRSALT